MNQKPGLIPISMATLTPSAMLGVDIYLRSGPGEPVVLFFSREHPVDLERLRPYIARGVNKLFIDRSDRDAYQRYLRDNWEFILQDESAPVESRLSIMNEVVRDVLGEGFSSGDTDTIVKASLTLADTACELLSQNEALTSQLLAVLHHDYATFTHSTNVSFYCVMLAQRLGFSADDLASIAAGGMVHDIGKLEIDDRILTKPGRLDESEFRIIQRHPIIGMEKLADRDDISYGQLMMCYQHHERLDGSGYPVGIGGDEIHPWAKLTAIVDVYEALTSQRPYRRPMSRKTAMDVLEIGRDKEFDGDMLNCWKEIVKQETVVECQLQC